MSLSTPVRGRVTSTTAPVPERRHPRAVLAAAMLGFFVVALDAQVVEGGRQGYGSTPILTAFTVAIAASAAFLAAQARGRHPMVPLELFRSRAVAILLAAGFIGMVGFYGTMFLQSLYFQQLRGESPAGQASFLHGLYVSYLTAAVLLAITAAASMTLPRVTR